MRVFSSPQERNRVIEGEIDVYARGGKAQRIRVYDLLYGRGDRERRVIE